MNNVFLENNLFPGVLPLSFVRCLLFSELFPLFLRIRRGFFFCCVVIAVSLFCRVYWCLVVFSLFFCFWVIISVLLIFFFFLLVSAIFLHFFCLNFSVTLCLSRSFQYPKNPCSILILLIYFLVLWILNFMISATLIVVNAVYRSAIYCSFFVSCFRICTFLRCDSHSTFAITLMLCYTVYEWLFIFLPLLNDRQICRRNTYNPFRHTRKNHCFESLTWKGLWLLSVYVENYAKRRETLAKGRKYFVSIKEFSILIISTPKWDYFFTYLYINKCGNYYFPH